MLLENNAILVDMIDRNVLMFLAAILSITYSTLMVLINQSINQSVNHKSGQLRNLQSYNHSNKR